MIIIRERTVRGEATVILDKDHNHRRPGSIFNFMELQLAA